MSKRTKARLLAGAALLAGILVITVGQVLFGQSQAPESIAKSLGNGAQLWAQLLNVVVVLVNVGVVAAVGRWTVITVRDMQLANKDRDTAASDREARFERDLRAAKDDISNLFEKDVVRLEEKLRTLERNDERFDRYFKGDEMTPGLVASTNRRAERDHDLMNNLTSLDLKLRLMADMSCRIAEKAGVQIDPKLWAAVEKPIEWHRRRAEESR